MKEERVPTNNGTRADTAVMQLAQAKAGAPSLREALVTAYAEHGSITGIAARFSVVRQTISNWLHHLDMTEDDLMMEVIARSLGLPPKEAVLAVYAECGTAREIARRYKVGRKAPPRWLDRLKITTKELMPSLEKWRLGKVAERRAAGVTTPGS